GIRAPLVTGVQTCALPIYVPGPVETRCCQMPGTCSFDPCSLTCNYCPGPTVSYQVQCPGQWVCNQVWVPREEVRTVQDCHYVRKIGRAACREIVWMVGGQQ